MFVLWSIILALAAPYVVWEIGKQLYTAAMEGHICTGRSMNVRVYRDKDRKLFRNNVVANIVLLPMIAGGAGLLVLEAMQKLGFSS